MKIFRLNRIKDLSGVSGEGIVAYGYELETGACVLSWHTEFSSIAIYPSLSVLEKIHSHEGCTILEVFDPKIHGRSYKSIEKFINAKINNSDEGVGEC